MIYTLFIYQKTMGLSLWEKSFEGNQQDMSMVSSFLSALQNMVKEVIRGGSKGFQSLDMGDKLLQFYSMNDLVIEIVVIVDRNDKNTLNNFFPKISQVLTGHKHLFSNWDNWNGDISIFNVLDYELLELVHGFNKTFRQPQSIAEVSAAQKEQQILIENEIRLLENKLKSTKSVPIQLELITALESIAMKTQNSQQIIHYQTLKKKIQNDLNETKNKAIFFSNKAKNTMNQVITDGGNKDLCNLDYKEVYLNLYSFSIKLRLLGKVDISEKYKKIALQLIEKEDSTHMEFSTIIETIMKTQESIVE